MLTSCNGSSTTDAGGNDTGMQSDAPVDAGPSINGCHDSDFVDITSNPTVSFAGTAYTPKCALVHAGTMVTFSGSFSTHPLNPGHSPNNMDSNGSPNNPIMATSTGATATFTFATAGDYPFYCAVHFAVGMNGVIRVQ
jgi:plastocyanin